MPQILSFSTCIYFSVCVDVCENMCAIAHVWGRRLTGGSQLALFSRRVGSRDWTHRSHQAGWQVTLSTQPSCLPVKFHPLGIHYLLQCHSYSSVVVGRHQEKIWGLLTGSEDESVTVMAGDRGTSRQGLNSTRESQLLHKHQAGRMTPGLTWTSGTSKLTPVTLLLPQDHTPHPS